MSDRPTARELHDAATDERIRVHQMERHEREVRAREKSRILAHMLPDPADRKPWELEDWTGFAPGCRL